MDYVDGPYMSMKQRREKPANSFQSELRQKMRDRKKMGLTADITSEESEGLDEGLDSEEENSMTMNYRMQHKRTDRPTSAKRRGKPDLEETMRASDANKWMKSTQSKKDAMSTLRETPPLRDSQRFSKQHTRGDIDQMFGTSPSPRSQTSPLDKKLNRQSPVDKKLNRQSPVEEGLFSKSKATPSPSGSGTSLPKSLFGGKKSPVSTQEMTTEEKIFGRKTPTNETQHEKEKEWKAPNFKRSSFSDHEQQSPPAAEFDKFDRRSGRKTPDSTSLQPITESPRPVPRSRSGAGSSPKDRRMKSRDSSPRRLSSESPRSERPKPKVDIFGRKEKHVELQEDESEKLPSNRGSRRFQRDDKKTLPGQRPTSGRLTPTGRKTPTGRETPTDRKSPSGRQTPTGRFSKSEFRGEKDDAKTKREPGLLDFLTDEAPSDKPKPKSRSSSEHRSTERRQSNLKKSYSQDSITEEFHAQTEQPSMYESSTQDYPGSRRISSDQSSVCLELDRDPEKEMDRLKEREKRIISKNQRSDHREADEIISRVENAQSDPKQITKDRPASAKTHDNVLRPKPRHSLPGSRPSSASTAYPMETFNNTMSIRQAIFDEWTKVKVKEISKKTQAQKIIDEEKKKKEKKDEQDKKLESVASYNAWMKQKEGTFVKDKVQKRKEDDKKQKDKEKDELQQKKEAMKDFKKWKERKDELLVDEHKKKVEEKHRKQQEERKVKKDKEKQNNTAFRGWKGKKDDIIKEDVYKKHEEKIKTHKVMIQTQKEKERGAMKEYNEWLRKKEDQDQREMHIHKLHKMKEEQGEGDFRPPWSPASKTIPCGR